MKNKLKVILQQERFSIFKEKKEAQESAPPPLLLYKGSLKIGRPIPITLHTGRDFVHYLVSEDKVQSESNVCHFRKSLRSLSLDLF